jgi:hypothetical protein
MPKAVVAGLGKGKRAPRTVRRSSSLCGYFAPCWWSGPNEWKEAAPVGDTMGGPGTDHHLTRHQVADQGLIRHDDRKLWPVCASEHASPSASLKHRWWEAARHRPPPPRRQSAAVQVMVNEPTGLRLDRRKRRVRIQQRDRCVGGDGPIGVAGRRNRDRVRIGHGGRGEIARWL